MSGEKIAHIIGAGLAGLSAAVRLADAGWQIRLYESSAQAGGRCRSYFDELLGCRIDNGNHLLLSGNRSAMAYLATIGAADTLVGPDTADFPFLDLKNGERWSVRPNRGALPYWVFDPKRRVAGTGLFSYLAGLKLAFAGKDATVTKLLGGDPVLFRRFWEPLAVAALNTEASTGAAHLLWPVMRETFGRGADYCMPRVVREGLSESFVTPALAYLEQRGGSIRYGARVRALGLAGDRAASLDLGGEVIEFGPQDIAIVAVPPAAAAQLLPGITVPEEFRGIANAHFRVPAAVPDAELSVLGVIGGTAEWIIRRGDLISVTVSAATAILDWNAETLARVLWSDVAAALTLPPEPVPAVRIVKEKRATFAQTPAQVRRRPQTGTAWRNVALAGDWTDTGLPATIEGAIRSGEKAAKWLAKSV